MKKGYNYLDSVPKKSKNIVGYKCKDGVIFIKRENTGFYNKIARIIFKRPRYTEVELEKYGMFIWQHIDGENTIRDIAKKVEEKFGKEMEPLYERICKYFVIMRDNGLVILDR